MFGLLVSRTTAGAAARHSLRASADVAARSSLTVGPLVDPIAVLCDDSTWSYCSEDYGHVKAIGKDSLNIDVSDDSLVKYRNRSGEESCTERISERAGAGIHRRSWRTAKYTLATTVPCAEMRGNTRDCDHW